MSDEQEETSLPQQSARGRMPMGYQQRRSKSVAIVVIVVLVTALLCCVCSLVAALIARIAFEGVTSDFEPGSEYVQWSGDGRFALIQTFDEDGVPLVAVWDRETGDTRTETGYHVIRVEPYGAVAWLVTEGDGASETGVRIHPMTDVPAEQYYVWELADEGPRPVDDDVGRQGPWPGPDEQVAYPEFDLAGGVYPNGLSVNRQDSPEDDRQVALPDGFGTFDLVGWSASGRYLAISERTSPGAVADSTRVLVIDAAEGTVAAETNSSVGSAWSARVAAWLPADDVLVASALDEDFGPDLEEGGTLLMALGAGGESVEAGQYFDFDVPEEWESASELMMVGSGPNGVMIVADGEIWVLDEDGVNRTGNLPGTDYYSIDHHPEGGILALDQQWDEREASVSMTVSLIDESGGTGELIWEGPRRPLSIEGW